MSGGGLNIKSPMMQQNALQLKFIDPITQNSDNSQWLALPRYWLGFHLAPLKEEWSFLRNNRFGPLMEPLDLHERYTVRWDLPQDNCRPLFYHNLFVQLQRDVDVKSTTWLTRDIYQETCKKLFSYNLITAWSNYWSSWPGVYHPDRMWKLLYYTYAYGQAQDTHYIYLHRKIPSKVDIRDNVNKKGGRSFKGDVACSVCVLHDEDQDHIIYNCCEAKRLWTFVYPTLVELLKPHSFKICDLVLGNFPAVFYFKKLIALTLIQITMHTIWRNRNSFRFDPVNKKPTLKRSHGMIKKEFFRAIKNQYDELVKSQLVKFRNRFCHTPKVIWIDNEVLYCNILKSGQG